MNETAINWTDFSWNPWSGCQRISAGCRYCYAEQLAEQRRGTNAFPNGFDLTLRPHKLAEPAKVRKPSLIFTNSMTDMFWDKVPDVERDKAFAAMALAPWNRYQVLTKRVDLAAKYFATRPVPPWVWFGATVENRGALKRIDILRSIPARVRFLSVEPLLTDLIGIESALDGIHWLIGGGESGLHLKDPAIRRSRALATTDDKGRWIPRLDRYDWARRLRDATIAAGAAFWWKQWGGIRPHSAGRAVDGREWDEMPKHVVGAMPDPIESVPPVQRRRGQLPLVA